MFFEKCDQNGFILFVQGWTKLYDFKLTTFLNGWRTDKCIVGTLYSTKNKYVLIDDFLTILTFKGTNTQYSFACFVLVAYTV
jgi:hypothetical protein